MKGPRVDDMTNYRSASGKDLTARQEDDLHCLRDDWGPRVRLSGINRMGEYHGNCCRERQLCRVAQFAAHADTKNADSQSFGF